MGDRAEVFVDDDVELEGDGTRSFPLSPVCGVSIWLTVICCSGDFCSNLRSIPFRERIASCLIWVA